MSAKSNEIELREEFMIRWREEEPPEVFCKKGVLRNLAKFTGKHLCQSLFFNKVAGNFLKNETLAQLFSCEFSKIFENIFFSYRTPPVATS